MAPTPPEWPTPKFTLHIDDLTHPGTRVFISAVTPLSALRDACLASFAALYTPHSVPRNVQTITFILCSIPGAVAHTTGSAHHKEIHLSLEHIHSTRGPRARDEIRGVLTHEAVHCFQHDAGGSCNSCPAFSPDIVMHTPLGRGCGPGFVQRLNARLETGPHRDAVPEELAGKGVDALWGAYCAALERTRGGGGGGGEKEEEEEREEEEGDDAMWEVVEVGEGAAMPLDTKTERAG
ncbi:hypothetical protein H0H87_005147 [Tephrocybe sp. NHM501043]|nr:hypothetical protein H0H87_005147 [Tephrocybe sp. NHM501043]